jgi:hypothetical protein
MSQELGAVLDAEGMVYGTSNVRVVDAKCISHTKQWMFDRDNVHYCCQDRRLDNTQDVKKHYRQSFSLLVQHLVDTRVLRQDPVLSRISQRFSKVGQYAPAKILRTRLS